MTIKNEITKTTNLKNELNSELNKIALAIANGGGVSLIH